MRGSFHLQLVCKHTLHLAVTTRFTDSDLLCSCLRVFSADKFLEVPEKSSGALQDHPMVDQTSMVGWTTKEWESYLLPRKIFLRFARDPVSLIILKKAV